MTVRRLDLPMQTRLAPIGEVNAETRTAHLVWSAGGRVKRFDWERGQYYMEELSLQPGHVRLDRLNNGAPLLDTHNRWDLSGVLGVVESGSARVDGREGSADVRFSKREEVDTIFRDVKDKIIVNVSCGYRVLRMEQLPPDERSEGLMVYRAIDWEPMELSLVPIGADAGAGVRSPEKDRTYPCEIIDTAIPAVPATQRKDESMTPEEIRAAEDAAKQRQQEEQARQEAARQKALADAAAAERTRIAEIRALCAAHQLDRAVEDELIGTAEKPGPTLEAARTRVLEILAEKTRQTEVRGGHAGIQTVEDEVEKRRALIVGALLHRAEPGRHKLEDASRPWAGYTLRELMRKMLELRGERTEGMSMNRMWERTFQSGSDLPNIVLDAANKSLRRAYEGTPRTFVPWCNRGTAPDFKNINRVQLSGAPSLLEVKSGGEFKRGTVSDGKEYYALATYGRILGINRQTIVNDDMGAFTRLPALAAVAAADLESDTVYGIVTTNGTLQTTGAALFSATHLNLSTGAATGTINVDTIGAGRALMRKQTGLEGRVINVAPKFLIVPAAKEGQAEQYTSANYVANAQSSINPFAPGGRNPLVPICEPRLDANSTAAWYLAADPMQIDSIEYSYLEGQEGVYLETRMGWDIDGMELKVRLDFAAKALDFRGLWKSQGS